MRLAMLGRIANDAASFIIFSLLDVVDLILCWVYKVVDFLVEAEWKPCYCFSARDASVRRGNIIVFEHGTSRVVYLRSRTTRRLHLEEISNTLYSRPSSATQAWRSITINGFKRSNTATITTTARRRSSTFIFSSATKKNSPTVPHAPLYPVPRWSDCNCCTCTSWSFSPRDSLFVRTQGSFYREEASVEYVLFIHGFISSSSFWTETVFPNFSDATNRSYRLLAVDLLGFGRSPKPMDSVYMLEEHVDVIEKSVIQAHKMERFHIVAHSLGCILALALAAKNPGTVKSLTLLSPPYFPVPAEEPPDNYVLKRIAPRRVWPLLSFGASMACWYEHISRTACLIISKNHCLWEFLIKLLTRNRMRTFLLEVFLCHTHNSAWHTLHNVICGTAGRMDAFLDAVREQADCTVELVHGEDDDLIPVQCSLSVKKRIPRAGVRVVKKKDHISIVVGRQATFARELEEIWRKSSNLAEGRISSPECI